MTPDGQAIQSIFHPTTSIWCLSTLPNGDIISGSSDGLIRLWTKDSSRVASEEERKELAEAVSKRQINKSQIGDVNKVDLPGMEALQKPGKFESNEGLLEMLEQSVEHGTQVNTMDTF
jgi:phospholipase A-2-activating protein